LKGLNQLLPLAFNRDLLLELTSLHWHHRLAWDHIEEVICGHRGHLLHRLNQVLIGSYGSVILNMHNPFGLDVLCLGHICSPLNKLDRPCLLSLLRSISLDSLLLETYALSLDLGVQAGCRHWNDRFWLLYLVFCFNRLLVQILKVLP